jgi:hypothetical protein
MKALFLSMQIESRKLDPLRFNGSAIDRVSVIVGYIFRTFLGRMQYFGVF